MSRYDCAIWEYSLRNKMVNWYAIQAKLVPCCLGGGKGGGGEEPNCDKHNILIKSWNWMMEISFRLYYPIQWNGYANQTANVSTCNCRNFSTNDRLIFPHKKFQSSNGMTNIFIWLLILYLTPVQSGVLFLNLTHAHDISASMVCCWRVMKLLQMP